MALAALDTVTSTALPESEGHPPAGLRSVVWNDPHVGGDHGWVEFVRVVDDEAALIVTPEPGTPLEAWRPMLEDLGSGDSYEWSVASMAYAPEWEKSTQVSNRGAGQSVIVRERASRVVRT